MNYPFKTSADVAEMEGKVSDSEWNGHYKHLFTVLKKYEEKQALKEAEIKEKTKKKK